MQDERAEIEEAVGQALVGHRITATIAITGDAMELSAEGPPVSIDIEMTIRQWPLLPPDMKRRRAEEIAGRLADAYHLSRATRGKRPGAAGSQVKMTGAIAVVVGLLALIGVVRWAWTHFAQPPVEVKSVSEGDDVRRERLARACEAMRDRLYKGASFGPFATEGWVVELWLARKGGTLREHAALTSVIADGKLTAAGDDALARVIDGTVEIADGFSEDMAKRSPGWGGAIMVFREGYARAFLEPDTRQRFVLMAERLADAVGAESGALYGRCAHLATHDIGAWYRGADTAGAVASMVYGVGFFADGPVLDRGAVSALRAPGGDLDGLRKAAADADADGLVKMITAQGGTVNTSRGVSLVFPLGGPTRPLAATRAVARKMGVGAGVE